jgi:hypothetical protein
MDIEDTAHDILAAVSAAQVSSHLSLVAISVKTHQNAGEPPRLHIIQLRTSDRIVIFEVQLRIFFFKCLY